MFGRDVTTRMAGARTRLLSSKLLLLALLALCPMLGIRAQDDPQYRMEIGAGVGLVAYEGDFNGKLFSQMQPMGAFVGRYNFDPYKDLRLNIGVGKIKGSSDKLETYYPDMQEQAYSFSNTLVDVSLVFEYNFWPYGTGRDYRGAKRLTPFIFGGLGATFEKGADKNVFTGNLPLGLGAKYKINERLNVSLDWTMHFSLSDELDGVKDPYQVKSSGAFKNTDCYSMLQLSLTYSFSAKCRTCNKEE